ncbi:MAG: hypothetical protein WKF84_19465 [Pyrinomonadaceae bacterium]
MTVTVVGLGVWAAAALTSPARTSVRRAGDDSAARAVNSRRLHVPTQLPFAARLEIHERA